ncbi:DUF3150 domain-containing protein [Photobacterium lutimaris]|uniref:DUF3150 domain-containing protein n=1 Tax=Photobacterium lutimaris TaxID=388278 RepID=A0A2T3ITV3_9GAMM|nr:DUF3150 domain-containing protein [Photobacterium lutimaris]PSU31783.1 hypothetical protein C9I99_21605 [Photobacterium lutimaris]TDR72564.1 uncharacterized protein DUF3150 [Photobacterium lutimaris]
MQISQYQNVVPPGFRLLKVNVTRCIFSKNINLSEIGVKRKIDRRVVSSGAKKMADDETINSFRRIQHWVDNKLDETTLPFSHGIKLVPEEIYDELVIQLKIWQQQYLALLTNLIVNYDTIVEEHAQACDDNPELPENFGEVVRSQRIPLDYVIKQTTFVIEEGPDLRKEFANSLLTYVAREADELSNKLISSAQNNGGTAKISRKQLPKIEKIYRKLRAMRSIDKRVSPLVQLVGNWLNSLPEKESFTAKNSQDFIQVLSILKNPELLKITNMEFEPTSEDDSAAVDNTPPASTPSDDDTGQDQQVETKEPSDKDKNIQSWF